MEPFERSAEREEPPEADPSPSEDDDGNGYDGNNSPPSEGGGFPTDPQTEPD